MNDNKYWKLGFPEFAFIVGGVLLGGLVGAGALGFRPAPPWWFLPSPGHDAVESLVEIDTWEQYREAGGYDVFWVQSTWGWALVFAIVGLVVANVWYRRKSW